MKELKTFTTGKGTYDSFPDQTARSELPKKLTRPATAQVGDYLRITAIGVDGTMEVEAVPPKVSAFENDAGYATEARVQELLAEFPSFEITVVQELPAVGAEKTIYLVPFADDSGSYLEYLWVNGTWEVIGAGKDSGENPTYELPVGGDELGGVRNGGNVVINADGTMTAPETEVTDEQVQTAVSGWLEANPDATTTVQDGAITERKLADNAVSYSKTAFATPNARLAKSERIVPNATSYNGYAGSNAYFDYYYEECETHSIYATPVKAGQTYTILTTDVNVIKFCTAYSLDEPPEEVKAAWNRARALLYKPSFTGAANLASRYSVSYSDRQNKIRFTPAVDGYILAPWHDSFDVYIYEGASPFVLFENWLDDAEGSYTIADAPLYNAIDERVERMQLLHTINPDNDTQRLLRRGEYYQNLICSSLQMVCIGDSITFGSSVGVGNRYHDFLQKKFGFQLDAWGHSGVTATNGYGMQVSGNNEDWGTGVDGIIAFHLSNDRYDVLPDDSRVGSGIRMDADTGTHYIFTIELGTNDWIYNAPLGSYEDSIDTASFYGCYKKLIAKIREQYPKAAVILLTPWQQFYNNIHYYEANEAGYSVLDYNLAIHEIAMMTRNCWVLDMLNSAYIKEKDNSPSGTYVDGVHIGRKAHILVAHELEKILMQVIMMNGYDYVPMTSRTDSFNGQK